MRTKALHNQSILDISIQQFGDVNAAVEIAQANNLSITDMLIVGNNVEIPVYASKEPRIQAYFSKHEIKPTTYLNTILSGLGISRLAVKPKPKNEQFIEDSQSSLDLSIQHSGGVTSLIELCQLNNISITDNLISGKSIKTQIGIVDQDTFTYYKNHNTRPATGFTEVLTATLFEAGLFEPGLFD